MTRPTVAVVVATLDRPALLAGTVTSVAAELRPGDELIVAEAGDSRAADALDAVHTPARREVVTVECAGKSRQLNAGTAVASAELVLLTDDDCVVPAGWVDGLAAAFADPTVAIAFGPIDGLTQAPGADGPRAVVAGDAPIVTWTYAHGASYAIRRSALAAVGGFDERLGPGAPAHGEEHDVLLRLREAGWRAVVAAAPPVHHVDWRDVDAERGNALVYERGAGAFIGAALRRDRRTGWLLLKHRLGYLRQLVADRRGDPGRFGPQAVRAFGSGLAYGLRLPPKERPTDLAEGPARH